MFCIKCGTGNSDEAVYCQKCGSALGDEEDTRIAPRTSADDTEPGERQIFSISPTLLFIKIGYVLAVLAAFLFVGLFALLLPAVSPVITVLIGLLFLLIPASYHLRQKLVRYTLTDSKIEMDEGFISRTTRNVPLRRIQDVTVSSTISQRLLGFGDLIIDNAGADGERIVLKNVNSPSRYADLLLTQIRRIEK